MSHLNTYLKKEFTKYSLDYLILFTSGVFFLAAVYLFKGERTTQFSVLLTFVSFYIIWGIYHHIIDDSLYLKTVVEYILIGFCFLFLLKIIILP